MSYILEALRKAESERHSGAVPGIHAAPLPAGAPSARPGARQPWLWIVLAAAATAGVTAVLVRNAPPPAVPATPATPAVPLLAETRPAPAPALAARREPRPPAIEQEQASLLRRPPPPQEAPAKKARPTHPSPAKKPEQAQEANTPAPAAEPAIPTLGQLPQQLQQEIPSFSLGGYIYSGNKADRSILVNKRLLREGQDIAPGLRLERMTPQGMVLDYKGHRFRKPY